MRFLYKLFAVSVVVGCSADVSESIVGTWSVTENVSGQVYELKFRADGALEQTVAGKTNVGRYAVTSGSEHMDIVITWANGSGAAIWARRVGPDSMEFYDDTGLETPNFNTAFLLGTLERLR